MQGKNEGASSGDPKDQAKQIKARTMDMRQVTPKVNCILDMIAALANLRRACGHVVERATLARDLLAPAASQLSGDLAGIHSRCVLAQDVGRVFSQTDDVRAGLEAFGAIEAIAMCKSARCGVIVFRDEASVAIAVRRQEEALTGLYSAVPPPRLALPLRFIPPDYIEVALYPPTPSARGEAMSVSGEASTHAVTEPVTTALSTETSSAQPGVGVNTQSTPLWMESRPAIFFQDPSGDERHGSIRFVPSRNSLIYGPTLGADGHLWMDGVNVIQHAKGTEIVGASVRVVPVTPPH